VVPPLLSAARSQPRYSGPAGTWGWPDRRIDHAV